MPAIRYATYQRRFTRCRHDAIHAVVAAIRLELRYLYASTYAITPCHTTTLRYEIRHAAIDGWRHYIRHWLLLYYYMHEATYYDYCRQVAAYAMRRQLLRHDTPFSL